MIWKMIKCHLFGKKEVERLANWAKKISNDFLFFYLKEIHNLQSYAKLTDINLSPVGREKKLGNFI